MTYRHHVTSWLAHPRSPEPHHTIGEFLASLNHERWMDDAACVGTDPEVWFPAPGSHDTNARTALRVCVTSCEVRDQCLAFALHAAEEVPGIWGGTTMHQRRALREKRDTA